MPTTEELFGGTMLSPVRDPYTVYRRLRREQPVILVQSLLGQDYVVTRYDDAAAVLDDARRFSSRGNARTIGLVMGRTILEMEGVEHVRQRKLITPFFAPSALRGGLQERIERVAHALLDEIETSGGRADLVSQFTFVFPIRVICQIIGIPVEDYVDFHRWAIDLISVGDDPPRGLAASQRIIDYLRPVLEARKAEPTGDLLSALAHAEVDGLRLTDEEVLSFLRLLVPAGADTTYRLIGSLLYALLTHPRHLEEVTADRGRLELAMEETLRWESPVQYVMRETTAEVLLGGVEIPAGALVSVALGSANRDEDHFPDPDRFDIERRPEDHLAFAPGQHFCAGTHLARAETRAALSAILDRLPNLRLDPREECEMVGLAFRSPDRLPVLFDR
jgi:cytochrome P450